MDEYRDRFLKFGHLYRPGSDRITLYYVAKDAETAQQICNDETFRVLRQQPSDKIKFHAFTLAELEDGRVVATTFRASTLLARDANQFSKGLTTGEWEIDEDILEERAYAVETEIEPRFPEHQSIYVTYSKSPGGVL
jgi:hypothetical protein